MTCLQAIKDAEDCQSPGSFLVKAPYRPGQPCSISG